MPSTRNIRSLSKDIETFIIPKENKMANQENAPQEVETPDAAPEASIGLNDLQLLRQIVDLASQRGAFRGPELTQVGTVYDKLAGFLDQMIAAQDEDEQAEQDTAETTEEDA